ncbi:FAD-binding protein [Paenirhodobacter sp.]|uniref:FAD-binding protein n=1 Tax=Paenirhodobacter sp. TaxID=1965326 RepID=UPI003B3E1B7A
MDPERLSTKTGATLAELADGCGIDAAGLEATVARYNTDAAKGEDPDFHRGETLYSRVQGDPDHEPNPAVAPIGPGPYYAVEVVPGSLGTFAGVVTDADGAGLGADDRPVPGLYAAGNDMNSIMGGAYPSGGITLGPAMTFGFLAAEAIASGEGAKREEGNMESDPQEVDLLVLGAGAGGMTAALVAALEGLDVLLVEKTGQVGGTTSTSGGTTWVPGTHLSEDRARGGRAEFLDAIVGNRGGEDLRTAFLASGPAAIAELEAKTEVKFAAAAAHPDYLDGPGQAYGGRALGPLAFDGRLLGADFDRIRPPRREFMGLGGMMVGRAELGALLSPFASLGNFRTTITMVGRYGLDRLRYPARHPADHGKCAGGAAASIACARPECRCCSMHRQAN